MRGHLDRGQPPSSTLVGCSDHRPWFRCTLGAVLSGATFGDNLSVISDTAIAASRLQGASMRDKFRANFWLALPAALACVVLLALLGDGAAAPSVAPASLGAALPDLIVLVLALLGVDVLMCSASA
ncbi:hypothetical protein [Tahibacter sp.]|uniref:hypothetical protein n=1 Tax=Tahibacter sp. TaxID=2056211 RepID=UPI0028C3E2ED|nr:hypothetical protein [Tahibacter sp.]